MGQWGEMKIIKGIALVPFVDKSSEITALFILDRFGKDWSEAKKVENEILKEMINKPYSFWEAIKGEIL